MTDTLVIQSHKSPLPATWINKCLTSVEDWAALENYDYRFLGDEIFESIPDDIYEKTKEQPIVASDLARLHVIKTALIEGYETVVWCDADFLIFDPVNFKLPGLDYGLGRETWIQKDIKKCTIRAYIKVHNAFLFFRQGNVFLDFYIDAATRLIRQHEGVVAPQFAGPKLLTAIHNVVQCYVTETAGMLCPLVQKDLLKEGGKSLDLFRLKSKSPIYAANLCSSLQEPEGLSDIDINRLIEQLLKFPGALFP
jgi:hypothetical protein